MVMHHTHFFEYVTKDTFPIDLNTLFLLSWALTYPDKLNFCLAEYWADGGGIIFGSAWRNIAAVAAVSRA